MFQLDAAVLHYVSMNCRNLEELELSGVTDVTDGFLISIAENCSGSLQFIGLKGCRQVCYYCSMFFFAFTTKRSRWRHSLNVKKSLQIKLKASCELFRQIWRWFTLYTVLYIATKICLNKYVHVMHISETHLTVVAYVFLTLSHCVDVACWQVTDTGVCALANCSKLTCAVLSGIHQLTDRSVLALANGCPFLDEIYLSGCSLVTRSAIKYLVVITTFSVHLLYTTLMW